MKTCGLAKTSCLQLQRVCHEQNDNVPSTSARFSESELVTDKPAQRAHSERLPEDQKCRLSLGFPPLLYQSQSH
jgi:hypothetical protein